MKEKYRPVLTTKDVTIFNKENARKMMIVNKKDGEITFQSEDKILKRKIGRK